MKRYALKLLSLLLVLATLSLMVSCDLSSMLEDIAPDDLGNGVENGSGGINMPSATNHFFETATTKVDNTFIGYTPPEDLDFEGKVINILSLEKTTNKREWYKDEAEDDIDIAIALRNQNAQDTLNVSLNFEFIPYKSVNHSDYSLKLFDTVMNDVNADLHEYDISANLSSFTSSINIRDYAADLNDAVNFPYFNFELPCWNQSIIKNTTVNDHLLYIAGDITPSMFDEACVVWYNKDRYDMFKEPSDPACMQELAIEGSWTYEELYRWSSSFYMDSNGKAGKQIDDSYGLIMTPGESAPLPAAAFQYAWDLEFISTNPDGTHSFSIAGNQKIEQALEDCRNIFIGNGTYTSARADTFAQGQALFYMGKLFSDYDSSMKIREMEDLYGLLPMPKYDVEQERYTTSTLDDFSLIFVLDHSGSTVVTKEAVSAFLQYACELNYTNVRANYFDSIVKPKFFGTNDPDGTVTKSIAIFNTVVDNINFDMCNIYSMQLNNINRIWTYACSPTSYQTMEQLFNAHLSEFEDALVEVDQWHGLS